MCMRSDGLQFLLAETGVALGIDLDLFRIENLTKAAEWTLCHLDIH